MDANLKRKENIEELMMEWQSDFEDLKNEGTGMNVLELLWPHGNLKKLIVALRISALSRKVIENIKDTMDIYLKRKESIEELMVEWRSDFDYLQNEGNGMNVLELPWTRRNLKKFIGEFYRGRNFPK